MPDDLRQHWQLIIGDSPDELPSPLSRCPVIDMFHHDSRHTFEHITWKSEIALPHLSPEGVLSSDDILAPLSLSAYFEITHSPRSRETSADLVRHS